MVLTSRFWLYCSRGRFWLRSSHSDSSGFTVPTVNSSGQGWQRAERAEHRGSPARDERAKEYFSCSRDEPSEQRSHPARSLGEEGARSARSAQLVGCMTTLNSHLTWS